MAIIDQELFVVCEACGTEVATGIRRTVAGLEDDPPGERRITCGRCGHAGAYGNDDYYHRTAEIDRELVDV